MRELLATTPEMLWLFGGLVGLLAVASTIGAVLAAPAPARRRASRSGRTWWRASTPGG